MASLLATPSAASATLAATSTTCKRYLHSVSCKVSSSPSSRSRGPSLRRSGSRKARLPSRVSAAPEDKPEAPPAEKPASPQDASPAKAGSPMDRGQVTAIITGGISLVVAVGYLVLVFLLDSRSGEMLPPPPEAFGP